MAESEFANLDDDLRRVGGTTSFKTVSQKHIISRKKLFSNDRWMKLSDKEKSANWNWARKSEEARKLREMEDEFSRIIESCSGNVISSQNKKEGKKYIMNRLEKCTHHGGTLAHADIEKFDELSDEQVLAEAKYLKKTTGPNIRLRHKKGNQFIKYTIAEVKTQIRNVINPECILEVNVDDLLTNSSKSRSKGNIN